MVFANKKGDKYVLSDIWINLAFFDTYHAHLQEHNKCPQVNVNSDTEADTNADDTELQVQLQ